MEKQTIVTVVVAVIVVIAAVAGLLNFEDYLLQYSYIGVFAISLIGSMSIIVPIPYTFILLTLSLEGMNPLLLTVAGGLGSGIGEFSGYILGYYGRSVISEKQQRKMDYVVRIFDRYGPIAIFVFALTPLPDDLLFIPLGMMRYKFIKAFIPSILGKTLMCGILAYGGQLFGNILSMIFGESNPEINFLVSIITAIVLVFVLVAMLKIDWEKVFERHLSKGTEEKVRTIAEHVARIQNFTLICQMFVPFYAHGYAVYLSGGEERMEDGKYGENGVFTEFGQIEDTPKLVV